MSKLSRFILLMGAFVMVFSAGIAGGQDATAAPSKGIYAKTSMTYPGEMKVQADSVPYQMTGVFTADNYVFSDNVLTYFSAWIKFPKAKDAKAVTLFVKTTDSNVCLMVYKQNPAAGTTSMISDGPVCTSTTSDSIQALKAGFPPTRVTANSGIVMWVQTVNKNQKLYGAQGTYIK
ncbi:MAG: hypothetical protein OEY93_10840 [Anaerolineae bacterium]|nr:hypothetical protein [Anaerolineae bacterium]